MTKNSDTSERQMEVSLFFVILREIIQAIKRVLKMQSVFIVMMLAYAGGNAYIFIRAMQTLGSLPTVWRIGIGVLFWVAALSLFFAMWLRNTPTMSGMARVLFAAGSVWLVFTLYMVMALLVTDALHLIWPTWRGGFWAALCFTAALLLYGHINYLNPRRAELDLTVDKPIEGGEMKMVAISDVHLGYGTGKGQLRRYVEMINAQQADVILICGDLIDNSLVPLYAENMWEELNELDAPMGIYMVAGNHEYISGIDACEEFLGKTQVRLLRDTLVELPNGVTLVMRDDRSNIARRSLKSLLEQSDESKAVVVMDHQPYNLALADSLGVDLQVSGHTHHGQVWPASLLTDCLFEQSHGYRRWKNAHIYVSSGLSLWGPPFRIGTRSDMAVITLREAR